MLISAKRRPAAGAVLSNCCIFTTITFCLLQPSQKYSLGLLPTPIHPWHLPGTPRGVEMWIKRDDLTGMQLSGNKASVWYEGWTVQGDHVPYHCLVYSNHFMKPPACCFILVKARIAVCATRMRPHLRLLVAILMTLRDLNTLNQIKCIFQLESINVSHRPLDVCMQQPANVTIHATSSHGRSRQGPTFY